MGHKPLRHPQVITLLGRGCLSSQASATEKGSQNEQQLLRYSTLDDAARKIPSKKKNHPEEDGSESENSYQEYDDFKRSRVMSKDDLAKYANEQFSLYTPEKRLQESIMNKNPIPRNVHPRPKNG